MMRHAKKRPVSNDFYNSNREVKLITTNMCSSVPLPASCEVEDHKKHYHEHKKPHYEKVVKDEPKKELKVPELPLVAISSDRYHFEDFSLRPIFRGIPLLWSVRKLINTTGEVVSSIPWLGWLHQPILNINHKFEELAVKTYHLVHIWNNDVRVDERPLVNRYAQIQKMVDIQGEVVVEEYGHGQFMTVSLDLFFNVIWSTVNLPTITRDQVLTIINNVTGLNTSMFDMPVVQNTITMILDYKESVRQNYSIEDFQECVDQTIHEVICTVTNLMSIGSQTLTLLKKI